MKKISFPALLAVLIFALNFTSCDDFFSSGWGTPRDYRVSNINLTVNNLERWFDRSIGNPDLAMRINEAIIIRLRALDPNDPARMVFQRYGIRIAISSSNMGVIILSNALDALTNLADIDDLEDDAIKDLLLDILGSIQNDFVRAGGVAAAESIAAIADIGNFPQGEAPTFPDNSFVENANPSEVAKAILVLTLAMVEKSDEVDDIADWGEFDLDDLDIGLALSPDGKIIVDGDPTPEALVLAAYLNLVNNDPRFGDSFLTGAIRDAFFNNSNNT